jgi:type I site-specific restriction-modification system R (restriction) subunit
MKFTEANLEQTFAELLQNEGYAHSLGETIVRNTDEALIESDLHDFLLRKYGGDNITENEIKQIILQLRSLPASDLYESNKKFCRNEIREAEEGIELTDKDRRELKPIERVKMIMTRNQDDEETLYRLLGSKDDRKELDRQFKNGKSNFKIAIVVDMWLTGFDVPFLDSIYTARGVIL